MPLFPLLLSFGIATASFYSGHPPGVDTTDTSYVHRETAGIFVHEDDQPLIKMRFVWSNPLNGKSVRAFSQVNTGSTNNFIPDRLAKQLGLYRIGPCPVEYGGGLEQRSVIGHVAALMCEYDWVYTQLDIQVPLQNGSLSLPVRRLACVHPGKMPIVGLSFLREYNACVCTNRQNPYPLMRDPSTPAEDEFDLPEVDEL